MRKRKINDQNNIKKCTKKQKINLEQTNLVIEQTNLVTEQTNLVTEQNSLFFLDKPEILRQLHKTIFQIVSVNYEFKIVVFFRSTLPINQKTIDFYNLHNCKYSIFEIDSKNISDMYMLQLDQLPC